MLGVLLGEGGEAAEGRLDILGGGVEGRGRREDALVEVVVERVAALGNWRVSHELGTRPYRVRLQRPRYRLPYSQIVDFLSLVGKATG